MQSMICSLFFFFNDTATTEIYTLSLHDALPISADRQKALAFGAQEFVDLENDVLEDVGVVDLVFDVIGGDIGGSGEHTSELQSQSKIVCRLLLVKKKKKQ